MSDGEQRAQLDYLQSLNELHRATLAAERDLSPRIESFELAYRMQTAAPEAIDIDREPQHIKTLYGLDDPRCDHVARQRLMARRLVERGVRFVQIYSGGMDNQLSWDGHNDIKGNHEQFAGETDKPLAGLPTISPSEGCLKRRSIWGPNSAACRSPRNPTNPAATTTRTRSHSGRRRRQRGVSHGETDEIGYHSVVDRMHVNDLHATILRAARPGSRAAQCLAQRQTLA